MSQDASALVVRYQLRLILREYRTHSFVRLVGRAWLTILSYLILGGLSLGGMFAIVLLGIFVLNGAWERIREEWQGWLYTALILGGSAASGHCAPGMLLRDRACADHQGVGSFVAHLPLH